MMKTISLLVAPVLISTATLAAAQTAPTSHEQHQTAGQHDTKREEGHCAQMMSEMHDMHKMMAEMMKMHQGTAAHGGHDQVKDKPQEQPKH